MTRKAVLIASCVVVIFLQPGTSRAADPGLVAWWSFGEGSGEILRDRSGRGNHGRISGCRWIRNGGSYALEFDGIDDYVDCGNDSSLDLRKQLTIMAWARPTASTPGEAGIAGKKLEAYVLSQHHSNVYAYVSGGPNHVKAQWTLNRWHHTAAVYNGRFLCLYIDGKLILKRPFDGEIRSGGNFWLGRSDGKVVYTKDAHFSGMITDVRVYNRGITEAEILQHMRTTNITNELRVKVIPLPGIGTILADIDSRALGPQDADITLEAVVRPVDDNVAKARNAWPKSVTTRSPDDDVAHMEIQARDLPSAEYALTAIARRGDGEPVCEPCVTGFMWPQMRQFPHGPNGARQLNNFVVELLHVQGPDTSGEARPIVNPARGWVYIANQGSSEFTLQAVDSAEPARIILAEKHGSTHETMLYLSSGAYTLATPAARELIVRTMPGLYYAKLGHDPLVSEFGAFGGAFEQAHVVPNVNTLYGDDDEAARTYVGRGKRWLGHVNFTRWPEEVQNSPDEIYARLIEEPGIAHPDYCGILANEFGDSEPKCAAWATAVARILSDPKYRGKGFYPYANDLSSGPEGRQLVETLLRCDGAIMCERYLKEQRSLPDAWRELHKRLVVPADAYRQNCPGSISRFVAVVGMFTGPPETLDTFPHVNHKRFLEMQLNLMATHPSFEGMGGLMAYSAKYSDEETVRWMMRLFRHYAIEGKTDMLEDTPYLLAHLQNGDFEEGGAAWDAVTAAPGSIRFGVRPGFGRMQGRYPYPEEGDTVAIMRRSEKQANRLSQEIRNLDPGRLYSLRLYSGDYNDLSEREEHAVSIELDGVTLLPDRSFTHIFHNHRANAHSWAPYNGTTKKAWMNYHWRLFRAKGETARLTVSDWAAKDSAGGPIGQEMMFNFVQIQPYFE